MSARSRNSKKGGVNRPFSRGVLAKARRLTAQYEIVLAFEDGRWYGHGLELFHVFGEGRSADACVADTRAALVAAAATMLEAGQAPPLPARKGVRSEQVNVRLTAEEKAVLEATARQKGFRGLSDFVRAGALSMTK